MSSLSDVYERFENPTSARINLSMKEEVKVKFDNVFATVYGTR